MNYRKINLYRQAVVVLGMHRGGTSALAGTAVRLGFAAPRTPLPASDDNPGGLYESRPIVVANHEILAAAGCAWNVCLTFDPASVARMLQPSVLECFDQLLVHEFGETASFVLKDPRLCLTLPAWLPGLRTTGAGIRVLVVVRHPSEVVRSLAARNGLQPADTAPHWLHHMVESERLSREFDRALVFFDDLLRDWRRCMARCGHVAGIVWPRPIKLAGSDVDTFLTPSLRHHVATHLPDDLGSAAVCDMVQTAWSAFQRLASQPEHQDALDCLDGVRADFANWRRATFPFGVQAVFPSDERERRA